MTLAVEEDARDAPAGDETVLRGAAQPTGYLTLEEIVRPFQVKEHGITVADGKVAVRLSYNELARRSAAVSARLRQAGVSAGTPVACTVTNDLSSILTVLGIWMTGGSLISMPPARTGRGAAGTGVVDVLTGMNCEFLVGDANLGEPAPPPAVRLLMKGALTAPDNSRVAVPDVAVGDAALIQFTSGSVGSPKGVVVGPDTLAGHLRATGDHMGLETGRDRVVSWLPLYHDMGLVAMFLAGLASRVDIVLSDPSTFARRPASWLTSLSRERATVTAAPDFAYRLAASVPYEPGLDLSGMRVSLSGGERLRWESLLDFFRAAGPHGFPWEAIQPSYGLAEGVVGTTTTPIGRGPKLGPNGHVSVGVPLAGVTLKMRSGLEPAPVYLGGASRFAGYRTASGFEPSTGPWHDTGDAGFTHDGELYVLGRRNEVISLAGRNIFAEDVEAIGYDLGGARIRACSAFRDPADDSRFSLFVETERALSGAPEEAAALAKEIRSSVIRVLGTRLASVRMVRPGTIPRTTSGKVRRPQCRTLAETGEVAHRVITELT